LKTKNTEFRTKAGQMIDVIKLAHSLFLQFQQINLKKKLAPKKIQHSKYYFIKAKYLRANFLMNGLLKMLGVDNGSDFPCAVGSPVWSHNLHF
jgi:hypothetical protein